jgi:hypothetical protein
MRTLSPPSRMISPSPLVSSSLLTAAALLLSSLPETTKEEDGSDAASLDGNDDGAASPDNQEAPTNSCSALAAARGTSSSLLESNTTAERVVREAARRFGANLDDDDDDDGACCFERLGMLWSAMVPLGIVDADDDSLMRLEACIGCRCVRSNRVFRRPEIEVSRRHRQTQEENIWISVLNKKNTQKMEGRCWDVLM